MEIYDSLSSSSKNLMFKEPFYGLFLITLNKEVSPRIDTLCVSKQGINVQLTVNEEFWFKNDEATRVGMLKHELLHIGFFHLETQDMFEDKELFNIAADLEINQYIGAENKGPTWMGLELKNFPELKLPEKAGSKVYYDFLSKINQQRQQQGKGQQGQGQPQQGQGQGQGQPGQGQPGQGQSQPQKGKGKGKGGDPTDSEIWDVYDAMKQGQKSIYSHELWKEFYEGLSEAEKKLIQKQIEHQLEKVAEETEKSRGLVPAEMKERIDALKKVEPPVIDWKMYLRRFGGNSNKIYTKKSRRKLNKRFSENPAIKIKLKKHILVARDTSGSTSSKDHAEFFNELHHIYKSGVKITVLDADAGCHDMFEYKGKPPDHISGRGGTDFDPAIKYFNDHHRFFDTLIYLTDGICPAPRIIPRTRMLWVISSGGTMEYAKNYPGKVCQINYLK